MAPELAARKVQGLPSQAVVLDPMMGSGTFPIAAGLDGHAAFGVDSDPLAVLIAQTAASTVPGDLVEDEAAKVVELATAFPKSPAKFDIETSKFIDYWFDPLTVDELGRLATAIRTSSPAARPILWCAFSRLIITKDAGVSRARDVSHSRPHRVRDAASFSAMERFPAAVKVVLSRRAINSHEGASPREADIRLIRGDARALPLPDGSIDAVMTSPPYLIAIDYLRGHRLSLVWMGYTVAQIRSLRGSNLGSERGASASDTVTRIVNSAVDSRMSIRACRIVNNYAESMLGVLREVRRVLAPKGAATFVIADARMEGREVSIETLVSGLAGEAGLSLFGREIRLLPADRRYLPPPSEDAEASLNRRMRAEIVLSFVKR
ncbi:class I SAM-dependent methyltransferase [Micromonospora haikouensis]|uniref:class I SAM-dependent methyltransferase n=1 Tax=Micromonospora haikouensis TaxID=686309 RepID=UPI00343684C9